VRSPSATTRCAPKLCAGGCEPGGIYTLAAAAIYLARWGIKGKVAGQPIWKPQGGALPDDLGADVHALLPLPRLPAADRQRQVAYDLSLRGLRHGAVERASNGGGRPGLGGTLHRPPWIHPVSCPISFLSRPRGHAHADHARLNEHLRHESGLSVVNSYYVR
jgi:hypothetical protein